MKYQIYLNKETTESVNLLAKVLKKKPATFLKWYLEMQFTNLNNFLLNNPIDNISSLEQLNDLVEKKENGD